MRYVALLRGVNLGKHRKVGMADLRAVLAGLGYSDVSTYLQSGNAIFTSPEDHPEALEREIRREIERTLGLDVPVLIRTPQELASVVAGHPFPHALAQPARYYVTFLSAPADPAATATLDPAQFTPEEFRVGDRAVYVWLPEGAQRAQLSNAFWERIFGVTATSRNWNTVTSLLDLVRRESGIKGTEPG